VFGKQVMIAQATDLCGPLFFYLMCREITL